MSFGTIFKLKKFLNRRNLELLDVVLLGLTGRAETAFNPFWSWFATKRGNNVAEVAYTAKALGELRTILQEYLRESQ